METKGTCLSQYDAVFTEESDAHELQFPFLCAKCQRQTWGLTKYWI